MRVYVPHAETDSQDEAECGGKDASGVLFYI